VLPLRGLATLGLALGVTVRLSALGQDDEIWRLTLMALLLLIPSKARRQIELRCRAEHRLRLEPGIRCEIALNKTGYSHYK
jgi:hypothetical protein